MTRVKYYTKYLFKYMLVIIIFYGFLKFMNYVDIYKILNGIYSINTYKLYICIYYIMNFLNIYFLNKLCLSDIFTLKYSYITRSNKNKKIFSILLLSILVLFEGIKHKLKRLHHFQLNLLFLLSQLLIHFLLNQQVLLL